MDTTVPMLEYNSYEKRNQQIQDSETSNQYIATTCVALGAVCAGSVLAWMSPVLSQLEISPNVIGAVNETLNETFNETFNETVNETLIYTSSILLTKPESSLVGAMLAVGALFGALPGGFIAEKYGRRKANLSVVVPFTLNWVFTIFASNPLMLYIARFFSGIATGAICVTAPMYIGEIAQTSIRGTLGSFFQMCICAGILITYSVGAVTNWVGLSEILATIPFLFALCFYFMPETPVYLVKIGDLVAAGNSLRYLRGQSYDVQPEIKTIQADLEAAQMKNAGLRDLVASKGNKKAIIAVLGLMVFQQLSGVNAVIFYTEDIFASAGSDLSPALSTIIVGIVQLIVAYVAAMIIEKADRRFYLMLSSAGMLSCIAALGIYFHLQMHAISFAGLGILPLLSLVLFIVFFSLGFGPIPWMIMGELFAPEVKGVASGLAVMCNWCLVFVVTFSFPLFKSAFGGHMTFYLFAIILAFGTCFIYLFVPETRGKSLQEIQAELNK